MTPIKEFPNLDEYGFRPIDSFGKIQADSPDCSTEETKSVFKSHLVVQDGFLSKPPSFPKPKRYKTGENSKIDPSYLSSSPLSSPAFFDSPIDSFGKIQADSPDYSTEKTKSVFKSHLAFQDEFLSNPPSSKRYKTGENSKIDPSCFSSSTLSSSEFFDDCFSFRDFSVSLDEVALHPVAVPNSLSSPIGLPIFFDDSFLSRESSLPHDKIKRKAPVIQYAPSKAYGSKYLRDLSGLDSFQTNALRILNREVDPQVDTTVFPWNGNRNVKININSEWTRTGQFKVIAKIASTEEPLFADKKNEDILFTTFKDHAMLVTNQLKDRLYPNAHLNIVNQFERLKQVIPEHVAEIYNIAEVRDNCGFFLVEYVPEKCVFWPKDISRSDFDENPSYQKLFKQLQHIFQVIYEHGICADLKPDNFKLNKEGSLVLIDIRENYPEDKEQEREDLEAYLVSMLSSFCEKDNWLYKLLDPRSSMSSD